MTKTYTLYLATKDNMPLVTKAFGHVSVELTLDTRKHIATYCLYKAGTHICDYISGSTGIGAIMVRRTRRRMSPQDNIIIGAFIRCLNFGTFFEHKASGYTPLTYTGEFSTCYAFQQLHNPIVIKTTQLWLAKQNTEAVLALVQVDNPKYTIVPLPARLIEKHKTQKAIRAVSRK